MPIWFELHKSSFGESERPLCTVGEFVVSTFTYPSGIEALRVRNARGEIIVLPFKGQQVWRAVFDGRDLTMQSMFDEPVDTQVYLETYGAFLIHCGLTGLGAPGPTDTHPLHGELPNARFQSAWLEVDEARSEVTIAGSYQHTVAFATHYRATTKIVMTEGSALLDVSVQVENLKRTPMDLMYLAHANFRPVDHGELHYCASYSPQSVRVRQTIPQHISPKPGYAEFLARLAKEPELHHTLSPDLGFDPEVVFSIDMLAGDDGFTHALQKHPDGTADWISYKPAQAPVCMRWICRTPDQNGLGVAFPSTSEVEGYTAEKAKGNIVELAGGDTWAIDMRMGLLTQAEVPAMLDRIESIKS
ncbi:MAG: DUF4432 family protein [Pseudomonadota bacterium]